MKVRSIADCTRKAGQNPRVQDRGGSRPKRVDTSVAPTRALPPIVLSC